MFPLQAWTEITLHTETVDASDVPATVSGLTGRVCLHWVRAHRRRYYGIWKPVTDYWAGDGSLGIRRSRYKLTTKPRGAGPAGAATGPARFRTLAHPQKPAPK